MISDQSISSSNNFAMGNSVGRKKSSMVWANEDDDDWETTESKKIPKTEKRRLLGERSSPPPSPSSSSSSSSEPSGREVKIKITKKQLKELLGEVEARSMPVDQVLSSLMDSSNQFKVQHQRSWRPSLQSIPEVLDQ